VCSVVVRVDSFFLSGVNLSTRLRGDFFLAGGVPGLQLLVNWFCGFLVGGAMVNSNFEKM